MLSKSRYCKGLQCPKILWLDINRIEERDDSLDNQAIFNTGNRVGELAREYYKKHTLVKYSENRKDMLEETNALLLRKSPVICEASFACKDGFCSIDILKNFSAGLEIVEVKSSSKVKAEHLDDMAFQYYTLNACGYNVKKISLMHINTKYERIGELDIKKLFALTDCTVEVMDKQKSIKGNIKKIVKIASADSEPDIKTGRHCKNPYPCPYIDYCSRNLQDEMAKSADGPLVVDQEKIKSFLDTLSYPLYYLDFETFADAIPPFDHTRPYQQITSQYSLHIQAKKNGSLKHREFLGEAGRDPRRALAERLCRDIPGDVCVVAYYMTFEKGRIAELAALFPDLSAHLMAIHNNVKDLIVPFRQKAWNSPAQDGSNSIKAVLPAMFPDDPELDYDSLDLIHDGGEAMEAYLNLHKQLPHEQERIRKALLAYCRLDTLAMVKILEELNRLSA